MGRCNNRKRYKFEREEIHHPILTTQNEFNSTISDSEFEYKYSKFISEKPKSIHPVWMIDPLNYADWTYDDGS